MEGRVTSTRESAFKEAKAFKLGLSEALTLAVMARIAPCHAGEIRKELNTSHPIIGGRLHSLIKKGFVRKIEGRTVYDRPTYDLTSKAANWKEAKAQPHG